MILSKSSTFNPTKYSDEDNKDTQLRFIDKDLASILYCLQGRVRFGSGSTLKDGENIAGQFLQITTNGVVNTESTFTHTLGSVPVGYIVLWQSIAGSIYQGPTTLTAWTSTTISLKGSAVSITALLFLLR